MQTALTNRITSVLITAYIGGTGHEAMVGSDISMGRKLGEFLVRIGRVQPYQAEILQTDA